MTSTPEDMAHQLEMQARVQNKIHDLIRAQQEVISSLKLMMTSFLEEKKNKKPRPSAPQTEGGRETSLLPKALIATMLLIGIVRLS